MSPSRRDFLLTLGLATVWPHRLLAADWPSARRVDRRLVLVFLEGGNDGLNTVVPFADDAYHRARPKLAQSEADVIRLDEQTGLHGSLAGLRGEWEAGRLAVLRDVGYDRPDLSHFVSRDIWHSGWRERPEPGSGWVGRAALRRGQAKALPSAALGVREAPLLLKNTQSNGLTIQDLGRLAQQPAPLLPPPPGADPAFERIARTAREAQELSARIGAALAKIPAGEAYPGFALAQRLRLAARLIRIEDGPPVLCLQLGGFDTHALQAGSHAALLRQLGDALAAFQRDLQRDGADQRTLTLVYSEFGRRIHENGSAGTDHGTAGPMFALGGGVRGGLLGEPPQLDAEGGNLTVQHDFRAVFSEALGDWLGWPTQGVFDGAFADGRARLGYLS